MFRIQRFDPLMRIGILSGSHDSLQPIHFRHLKHLGIRSQNFDHRPTRISAPCPTFVPPRHHAPNKSSFPIGFQPGYQSKSISLRSLRTEARIRPDLVFAHRPRLDIAHGHQLRTIRPHAQPLPNAALVDVLDHYRSRRPHKLRSRPRRRHRVIDEKLPHLRQTPLGQGPTVGDFEGSEVFLGVGVPYVHSEFDVFVSLGEVGDVGSGIGVGGVGSEFEDGGVFVHAAVAVVADVSGSAGALGGVVFGDGAGFVFSGTLGKPRTRIHHRQRTPANQPGVQLPLRLLRRRHPIVPHLRIRPPVHPRHARPPAPPMPLGTVANVVRMGQRRVRPATRGVGGAAPPAHSPLVVGVVVAPDGAMGV
mmetsp:Transcript_17643/g.37062  ORF Transcript_17643/g.37062 Transcript_17643/m.37062 type:complete len:362 (-) Transcript_17643:838-1923(-)